MSSSDYKSALKTIKNNYKEPILMEPLLKKKSKEPHYKFKYFFFFLNGSLFIWLRPSPLSPCVCVKILSILKKKSELIPLWKMSVS